VSDRAASRSRSRSRATAAAAEPRSSQLTPGHGRSLSWANCVGRRRRRSYGSRSVPQRQPHAAQNRTHSHNRVSSSPPPSVALLSTDALCTTALFRAADQGLPIHSGPAAAAAAAACACAHWPSLCCCFRPFQLRAAAHHKASSPPLTLLHPQAPLRIAPLLHCSRWSLEAKANKRTNERTNERTLLIGNVSLIAGPARPFLLSPETTRESHPAHASVPQFS
jgi:hypothetical protein